MEGASDKAADQRPTRTTEAIVGSTPRSTHDSQMNRQSFMFIDSRTDLNRAREAVRVHAMRTVHQKRRLLQANSTSTRDTLDADQMRKNMDTIELGLTTNIGVVPVMDKMITTSADQNQSGRRTSKDLSKKRQLEPVPPYGAPQNAIGAGRRDPFGQYPIHQTAEVDLLVDYYVIYFMTVSQQLLPLYRCDSASFNAMLAFAAKHKAGSQGQTEPANAARYRGRALEIMSNRLQNEHTPPTDGTMLASAILASVDESWGENAAARIHWTGLKAMLRARGGLQGFWTNRTVHTALLRLDMVVCTGSVSSPNHPFSTTQHGSLSLSTDFESQVSARSEVLLIDGTTEAEALSIIRASEEFVAFVHNLDICIIAISDAAQPPPRLTHTSFQASTTGRKRVGRLGPRIEKCCQMACAIYLACSWLGFSSSVPITASETYNMAPHLPAWILLIIYSRADWLPLQLDAEFLCALLQGKDEIPRSIIEAERLWLVARLMSVAKKLAEPSWNRLLTTLTNLLCTPQKHRMASPRTNTSHSIWDSDELRQEIYGDLYSYFISRRR
ncbi:hypothetical protein MMC27_003817 [Xylographa pallens]|nr:hypothetical protein [Xylographa pallens]